MKLMSKSVLSGLKTRDKVKSFYTWLIHDCEYFEWLQNLWYRSTHSCDVKFSQVFIRYKDTWSLNINFFCFSLWIINDVLKCS